MNNRSGLSFADVLILVAIVLLLAALAIPKFVKATDYGNEEDEVVAEATALDNAQSATNRANETLAKTNTDATAQGAP